MDTDAFAASLGLAVPPRVRFLQKQLKLREDAKNKAKNSGEGKSDVVNKAGEEVKKEKKITLTIDSEGKYLTKLKVLFLQVIELLEL